MRSQWFRRLFGPSKVRSEDLPVEEQMNHDLNPEEEEQLEERGDFVIPYQSMLLPLKAMTAPNFDVEGFRFSIGIPLSEGFLMQHAFNLSSKKSQGAGNTMMEMFGPAAKTPFYQLGLMFNHIRYEGRRSHLSYGLQSVLDSNGALQTHFSKQIGKLNVRLGCNFPNSEVSLAQPNASFDFSSANAHNTVQMCQQSIGYNLVERLGRKLFFGLELAYLFQNNAWANGVALRFRPTPNHRYFMQYSNAQDFLTLGAHIKLNEFNSVATEFEIGGPMNSEATLAYKTKSMNYMVESLVRTNGDLRSVFTYTSPQFYKFKLFLSGSLKKEDFKTGFLFLFGQTED